MQFEILAKHPETGDELTLIYDNTTNLLKTAQGNAYVFQNQNQQGGSTCSTCEPPTEALRFSKDDPAPKSRQVRVLKIQLGLSCNYSCDYCSQRFIERPKETSKKDIDDFMAKMENLTFDEEQGLKIEMWGGEPFVYWKTM